MNLFRSVLPLLAGVLIVLGIHSSGYAYHFYYDDRIGDFYGMETYSIQEIWLNNVKIQTMDQKYQAEVKVVEPGVVDKEHENKTFRKGTYYFYMRPYQSAQAYALQNDQTRQTEFTQTRAGTMQVTGPFLYPTIRSLPTFPDYDIPIGFTWKGEGQEAQDLREWGMAFPYTIPIQYRATYLRDEKYKERDCAIVRITYDSDITNPLPISANAKGSKVVRIIGGFTGEYYWNKETRYSVFYKADYTFIYILEDGNVWEFRGHSYGDEIKETQKPVPPIPVPISIDRKKEIFEDIVQEMKKKQPDIPVSERPEGITLVLGDVLFETAKHQLTPEATNTLDSIAEILKRYENFNLLIEGHTDNRGIKRYNQDLSLNRADSVLEYLKQKGVKPLDYQSLGWNFEKPVASNATDDGRQKNRRVEITIVTDPKAWKQIQTQHPNEVDPKTSPNEDTTPVKNNEP